MKTDTKVEGMDRRIFLKSIGWPALGLLSASLLSSRSEAKEPTKRSLKRPELEKPLPEIMELGVEKSESFVKSMIEASEQAKLVQRELEKRDLMPMIERARGFTVYSEIDKKSVAIAVAPFVSDEDVGSLSVSENGLAKGVVVKVDPKTSRVIEFFTIDVVEGKIRTDAIPTPDLKRLGPATLVDKIGRLERPPQSVELSIEQTR